MDLKTFFDIEPFEHRDLWQETLWSPLLMLKKYLRAWKAKIEIDIPKGVTLQNQEEISIGEGTVIEPGVLIQGPCIIGKRCVIRHSAYLRGDIICGDECQIGHSAELKHSILLNRAAATHFVYVGDSILGNGVNLGAGVKCANLRLDRQEVSVVIEGEKINTGLKKLGAIVGDRAQVGCNCVFNPGTLMGKESFSFPLVNLSGFIPQRSQVSHLGIKPIEQKILEKLLWTSTAPK